MKRRSESIIQDVELNLHRDIAQKEMKAFLVLEFFTPSPGLPSWSPKCVDHH